MHNNAKKANRYCRRGGKNVGRCPQNAISRLFVGFLGESRAKSFFSEKLFLYLQKQKEPVFVSIKSKNMQLISLKIIRKFYEKNAISKNALLSWATKVESAVWRNPLDVLATFPQTSWVGADRAVFRIKGNDYRLVAGIDFSRQTVLVVWIGTHAQYDEIDAKTVSSNVKHDSDFNP